MTETFAAKGPETAYRAGAAPGTAASPAKRHFTQLDAVRAFAALTVIFFHEGTLAGHPFVDGMPFFGNLGGNGVAIFFVLSGFLITGILLDARDDGHRDPGHGRRALKAFYARRFLRIFPLYYLVLGLLLVFGVQDIRQTFVWHALYLSNILDSIRHFYVFPSLFWSLAVEEQFYLLWAPLVLFLRRRWLDRAAVAMVVIGPISRVGIYLLSPHKVTAVTPTSSCLDLLGLGCCLAILWSRGQDGEALRLRLGRVALAAAIALWAVETTLEFTDRGQKVRIAINTLPAALFGFWLVDRAARGFRGWPGRILASKPLVYLGTISYGLYVYHKFLPIAARGLGLPVMADRGTVVFLADALGAVVVASISWWLFERPLNQLKRYFPYDPHKAST